METEAPQELTIGQTLGLPTPTEPQEWIDRPLITLNALLGEPDHAEAEKRIREIHLGCRTRGFYDGVVFPDPRHHASIVALFGTEITESFVDLYEEGGRHLGEELADVVLRVVDYVGWLDWNDERSAIPTLLTAPRNVFRIPRVNTQWAMLEAHRANSMALEALRKRQPPVVACAYLCHVIFQIAEQYDIDLAAEFQAKLAKNQTRPRMHGGKSF